MRCASTPGVMPGLGFQHLSTAAAKNYGSGGARGNPRGESAESAEACCNLCASRGKACTVWYFRQGKCYPGSCTTDGHPCFERLRTAQQPPIQANAGVSPTLIGSVGSASGANSALPPMKLCMRPQLTNPSTDGRRAEVAAAAEAHGTVSNANGLAILLLGHRSRLMLDTLPANVIRPVAASGAPVDFFAYLENSTMARAFRGRRPMGNPAFASMDDDALVRHLVRIIEASAGHAATIHIGPRPAVELPAALPMRLSRYSEQVKVTVATRFAKERLGLHMVMDYEKAHNKRYAWVLWTREDSHWFAPLQLHQFQRGKVHGKICGGFGGWNDKVWLMDREWAPHMLSMYEALHTAYPAPCSDLVATSVNGGEAAAVARSSAADGSSEAGSTLSDFLAAPSVEQFRERVGKLHRVPFVKHQPEALPTIDSYFSRQGDAWKLCFPRIYAKGCVPKVNQSDVERHSCD